MSNNHSTKAMKTCICALVMIGSVQAQAQTQEIRSCVIVPSAVVELSVAQPGVVQSVHVGRGDAVQKGDILVELDDSAIAVEMAVAQRRATDETQLAGIAQRVEVLKGQLERMQSLTDRALVRQNEVDRLEDQLLALFQERDRLIAVRDLAALDVKRVQAQLALRTLRAPTEGIITARDVDPGEYATEQRPVLTVATLDPLHVELFVPLEYRDRINPGDEISVFPFIGGVEETMHLTATVEVLDRVFDAASGTFGVRLSMPNPDIALPAGLRCKASI